MITFGFLLFLILLSQLIIIVDMYLFQYDYIQAFLDLIHSQGLTDRLILFLSVIWGLGWSIVTDIRRKKKQKKTERLSN